MTIITILLAVLGLGFLVFIHELGHFWIARKQGMRVEAFAIGFGKPLFTWSYNGVKWHICMLPFGGYVKIAGMQKEGNKEPSEIADGFFGKKPSQRIQVALAGPLVNIAFALVIFTILWFAGGRNKQFAEYTHRIGWIDTQSTLFANGVRPGDIITQYDGRSFNGFKDLIISGLMKNETTQIEGIHFDYATGHKSDFNYLLKPYDSSALGKDRIQTIGVLSPARYLIFNGELPPGSPMSGSGIQKGDRILWANGEILFSQQQLSQLTNEATAFLTVQRGEHVFHTKVPRVLIGDLQLSFPERGELDDWQHEAGIKKRLNDLFFIPYNLSPTLVVENTLSFIDEQDKDKAMQSCQECIPLQENDHILAIGGESVYTPYDFLTSLQEQKMLLIVDRSPAMTQKVLWTEADAQFDQFSLSDLQKIVASIGQEQLVVHMGTLQLLKPITPKPLTDLQLNEGQKAQLAQDLAASKKEIDQIQDPEKRFLATQEFEKSIRKQVLGLPLVDREVRYNPTPGQQFLEVFQDTWRTLYSLFTGIASPKYVAGPVGIVQIVHQSWMIGIKEALFWLGLISLNLGIINLLPLPVLDGGHIFFSCIEMITKRPIKAKMMEKLIIPFVVLLIGFFIFVTYHDIARLLSKFF